jgi:hypothetical protein
MWYNSGSLLETKFLLELRVNIGSRIKGPNPGSNIGTGFRDKIREKFKVKI